MGFHLVWPDDSGIEATRDADPPFTPCQTCGADTTPDHTSHFTVEVLDAAQLNDLMIAAPLYIASERFVEWYRGSGLTGLDFTPAEADHGLSRLVIAGRARLDPDVVELVETCPRCGRREHTLNDAWAIDERAWDASAFVELEERPGMLVATDAARQALEGAPLTGLGFQPVEEVFV